MSRNILQLTVRNRVIQYFTENINTSPRQKYAMRLRNSNDQSGRNNCCPTKHRCVSCTKKNKGNNDPPGGKKQRAIKKEITWPLCYLRSRSERRKSLSSKAQKKEEIEKRKTRERMNILCSLHMTLAECTPFSPFSDAHPS